MQQPAAFAVVELRLGGGHDTGDRGKRQVGMPGCGRQRFVTRGIEERLHAHRVAEGRLSFCRRPLSVLREGRL